MKVIIQHKSKPNTGKGNFVSRLIPALELQDIEVTGDITQKADIALHIGRKHYSPKVSKEIIRVGPACVDSNKNYLAINREKAKSVKRCDAVIYQSQYSKKVYHHLVYKPNVPETVIFNGAEQKLDRMPSTPVFFMCTRRWWPQKRLKYGIRAFNEANIPDSILIVAGDYSMTKWHKGNDNNRIIFTGIADQQRLHEYRLISKAHIHLTWLDACPNSVVESLCVGCPVICTNQGGTPEIVSLDNQSTIIDSDEKYKYNIVDLNKPPKINVNTLAELMIKYSEDNRISNVPELDINRIALQYKDFFEKCLNSKS